MVVIVGRPSVCVPPSIHPNIHTHTHGIQWPTTCGQIKKLSESNNDRKPYEHRPNLHGSFLPDLDPIETLNHHFPLITINK